jgi:hypothetical protein
VRAHADSEDGSKCNRELTVKIEIILGNSWREAGEPRLLHHYQLRALNITINLLYDTSPLLLDTSKTPLNRDAHRARPPDTC